MKCYIDFDDTLMDTKRLCEDVFSAFGLLSAEEVRKHYNDFKRSQVVSVSGFRDYLNERGIDGKRMFELFQHHAAKADTYLFDDAIPFLKCLKENGHELCLLTFSTEIKDWQKPKVEASGITRHLDEVHMTDQQKSEMVRSLNQETPFVFIDDKASEIEAMQAAFPNALCLKHESGRRLVQHLPTVEAYQRLYRP